MDNISLPENEKEEESKKIFNMNIVLKIVIPIVMICVIATIWVVKNNEKKSEEVVVKNSDFALNVTQKINLKKLKSYKLPIIIDFGSESCAPCRLMAPDLKELNSELQGRAIIKFVDSWENPKFAEGYPISSIPTQFFFDSKGNPFNPKNPEAMNLTQYSLKTTGEHVYTAHVGGLTKQQMVEILEEMGMK